MRMPVLSAFLDVKGRQLRGLAVNEIGRAMAAAALAEGMDALSGRLAAIGLSEIAEGISELEAADALLDARDDAVAAGIESAATGVAELSAAQAGARATRQLAGAGMVMATQGAEEVGAAEGLAAGADAPKAAAKPAATKAAAKAPAKPTAKATAKSGRQVIGSQALDRAGRPARSSALRDGRRRQSSRSPITSESSSACERLEARGAGRTRSRSGWSPPRRGGRRGNRAPAGRSASALDQRRVPARVRGRARAGRCGGGSGRRRRRRGSANGGPVDQLDQLGVGRRVVQHAGTARAGPATTRPRPRPRTRGCRRPRAGSRRPRPDRRRPGRDRGCRRRTARRTRAPAGPGCGTIADASPAGIAGEQADPVGAGQVVRSSRLGSGSSRDGSASRVVYAASVDRVV